jgi:hypothetical protein
MNEEEKLIHTFYYGFQQNDWRTMGDCYLDDAFFFDPVFGNLEGGRVRAMWEMLLTNAKDLELTYANVRGEGGYGSCDWTASYTFGPARRRVTNRVKAHFAFDAGRIAEHQDEYSLWRWSGQALGLQGLFFGWTPAAQGKIRRMARARLDRFLEAKTLAG